MVTKKSEFAGMGLRQILQVTQERQIAAMRARGKSFEERVIEALGRVNEPELRELEDENPVEYGKIFDQFIAAQKAAELRQREREIEAPRRERDERLRRAGVRVTDACFKLLRENALEDTQAVKAARDWWQDRLTPWLVLSGRAGSGKTVAAASRVADWGPGLWLRADDIVRAFAGMFGEAFDLQQRAKDTSLLVIDDIGSEQDSPRMLSALLELLDVRLSAKARPTVATTNLTAKEFRERYANERLMSRLSQLVTWSAITGGDMRRKVKSA